MILEQIWVISENGTHLYSWKPNGKSKIDDMLLGTVISAILDVFKSFILNAPVESFTINDFLGVIYKESAQYMNCTVVVLAQINLAASLEKQREALTKFCESLAREFRKTCSQDIRSFAESHSLNFETFEPRCIALMESFGRHFFAQELI